MLQEGDSQVSDLGCRTIKISVLFTLTEVWLLQGHAGKEAPFSFSLSLSLSLFLLRKKIDNSA